MPCELPYLPSSSRPMAAYPASMGGASEWPGFDEARGLAILNSTILPQPCRRAFLGTKKHKFQERERQSTRSYQSNNFPPSQILLHFSKMTVCSTCVKTSTRHGASFNVISEPGHSSWLNSEDRTQRSGREFSSQR